MHIFVIVLNIQPLFEKKIHDTMNWTVSKVESFNPSPVIHSKLIQLYHQ